MKHRRYRLKYPAPLNSARWRCPWVHCAHGMGLAGRGVCSNAKFSWWWEANCPGFITIKNYEARMCWSHSIRNMAHRALPMPKECEMQCDECGGTDEVIGVMEWWTAWGRNCFDFNWSKNTGSMKLCEGCESRDWAVCEGCGALIDNNYVGRGYISDDPDHDYLCPDCAGRMDNIFKETP